MQHNKHPDQHPMHWLDTDNKASGLLLTAHRLIALEKAVKKSLPMALAAQIAVTGYDQNTLVVTTYHPALAAKLRQMTTTLCEQLSAAGWNVQAVQIRIGVQTVQNDATADSGPRQVRPLSAADLAHFESLTAQMQPGRLADAIETLIKRHRPS